MKIIILACLIVGVLILILVKPRIQKMNRMEKAIFENAAKKNKGNRIKNKK